MKVKSVSRTQNVKKSSSVKKSTPRVSFKKILGSLDNDREHSRHMLDELLAHIEQKGNDLIEHRTVESLIEYRDMIKSFIQEAVDEGFEIQQRRGISPSGRNRVMRTVKEVDKRLVELTNMILKQESKQIRVLEKVGQIQGLLVNLVL